MIDPRTQAILQAIVRRESRSLSSYIGDADPWTTTTGSPALATLRQGINDKAEAVNLLGRYLIRQKAPVPFLGSYPASFTSLNFVSLEYLLPRLVASEKELIAALEADVRGIEASEPRAQVEALLAVKRRALATMEGLADHRPAPVSA